MALSGKSRAREILKEIIVSGAGAATTGAATLFDELADWSRIRNVDTSEESLALELEVMSATRGGAAAIDTVMESRWGRKDNEGSWQELPVAEQKAIKFRMLRRISGATRGPDPDRVLALALGRPLRVTVALAAGILDRNEAVVSRNAVDVLRRCRRSHIKGLKRSEVLSICLGLARAGELTRARTLWSEQGFNDPPRSPSLYRFGSDVTILDYLAELELEMYLAPKKAGKRVGTHGPGDASELYALALRSFEASRIARTVDPSAAIRVARDALGRLPRITKQGYPSNQTGALRRCFAQVVLPTLVVVAGRSSQEDAERAMNSAWTWLRANCYIADQSRFLRAVAGRSPSLPGITRSADELSADLKAIHTPWVLTSTRFEIASVFELLGQDARSRDLIDAALAEAAGLAENRYDSRVTGLTALCKGPALDQSQRVSLARAVLWASNTDRFQAAVERPDEHRIAALEALAAAAASESLFYVDSHERALEDWDDLPPIPEVLDRIVANALPQLSDAEFVALTMCAKPSGHTARDYREAAERRFANPSNRLMKNLIARALHKADLSPQTQEAAGSRTESNEREAPADLSQELEALADAPNFGVALDRLKALDRLVSAERSLRIHHSAIDGSLSDFVTRLTPSELKSLADEMENLSALFDPPFRVTFALDVADRVGDTPHPKLDQLLERSVETAFWTDWGTMEPGSLKRAVSVLQARDAARARKALVRSLASTGGLNNIGEATAMLVGMPTVTATDLAEAATELEHDLAVDLPGLSAAEVGGEELSALRLVVSFLGSWSPELRRHARLALAVWDMSEPAAVVEEVVALDRLVTEPLHRALPAVIGRLQVLRSVAGRDPGLVRARAGEIVASIERDRLLRRHGGVARLVKDVIQRCDAKISPEFRDPELRVERFERPFHPEKSFELNREMEYAVTAHARLFRISTRTVDRHLDRYVKAMSGFRRGIDRQMALRDHSYTLQQRGHGQIADGYEELKFHAIQVDRTRLARRRVVDLRELSRNGRYDSLTSTLTCPRSLLTGFTSLPR